MIRKSLLILALAVSAAAGATPASADPVAQNDLLNATLWVSNSVEYKANTEQAYMLGQLRLDQALADKSWRRRPDRCG